MKNQNDSKKLILTFDYELFMGNHSGTVVNCLLRPTSEILSILKKNGAKAIFFVDATFLKVLKADSPSDYILVKNQIQQMCIQGHSVDLHIHPQWLDAFKLNEKEWGFHSTQRYRLDLFSAEEVRTIFSDSYSVLNEILEELGAEYKIKAFRAGGWCLPSFTTLDSLFKEFDIQYDFSVLPGMEIDNGAYQKYNYRKAPLNRNFWKFSSDVCLEEDGPYVEVPCTMIKFSLIDLILNKMELKGNVIYGDGVGASHQKSKKEKTMAILANPFKPISLDGYLENLLFKIIPKVKGSVVTVVGHPKSFGSLNLHSLDELTKKYKTLLLNELKV